MVQKLPCRQWRRATVLGGEESIRSLRLCFQFGYTALSTLSRARRAPSLTMRYIPSPRSSIGSHRPTTTSPGGKHWLLAMGEIQVRDAKPTTSWILFFISYRSVGTKRHRRSRGKPAASVGGDSFS